MYILFPCKDISYHKQFKLDYRRVLNMFSYFGENASYLNIFISEVANTIIIKEETAYLS
jgi:hypothetical protein